MEVEGVEIEKDPVKPPEEDFKDPKLPKGTFSHSQYTQYKICAKQYEFKYVQGMRGPPSPNMGRGTSIHKAVEMAIKAKIAGQPIPDIKDLNEILIKEFDEKTQSVVNWDDQDPGEVKKEAVEAYRTFHLYALPKLNPIAVEKGFAVKVGTVPMVGYIDLIETVPAITIPGMSPEEQALAPTTPVVVDLKTTRASWGDEKVRKNTQLTLYTHVEGVPNARIDQLVLLKKGPVYKPSATSRTPQDAAVFIEDLEETVDLVKKGIFPKTTIDSWACNEKQCPFWTLCRGRKK
jgi:CRISPR/Cas system-associated exonuclease Cas4 (RecB family)